MNFNRNLLSEAVRYGLAAGAVGLIGLAAAPAHAQEDEAATLDRIEVTGSRIKRVDVEGPNPITVITREDLEIKGDLSVADVLRSSTFNTFGSFQQSSGSTAQSQATINLRGVGSNRTLILLDGRRMAGSPVFDGGTQNLNAIPFAAVERIEVLRDGASAIYGSDAIGGVINVILRKDYEGLTIAAGVERPTRGEPDANSASITGGVSSDRGNITFVVDHQERDIMFNRDRDNGQTSGNPGRGLSAYGFPPSADLYDSTDGSFSNPDGSPADYLGVRADPRCPTALGSDPLFPNSVLVGTFCRFNYAATSANEASLRRDSVLVTGNFQLTDNVSAFARINTLTSDSFGRYAAAPFTNRPTMAGNNPNNPFGQDLQLYYRFVPGGARDSSARDHMLDVLFGLEGQLDIFGGADWEIGMKHARYEIDNIGSGYALGPPLQGAIDNGSFNPFGDPRDPAVQAGIAAISHTVLQVSETRVATIDGQMSFDLFEMANGPAGIAIGFDYSDERFSDLVDAQSAAGNVLGTAGGNSSGERARSAIFAEAAFPLLSTLTLTAAARMDRYNDFGDDTNPRVSLEFRPLDALLFRASWGTGFRAPTLGDLYRSPAQTFTSAIDTFNCPDGVDLTEGGLPFNPCDPNQYEASIVSNPNLEAEESTNWGAGVVWSPIDNLSLSLDYYKIELEQQISTVGIQTVIDRAYDASQGVGSAIPGATITRNAAGAITFVVLPAFNLGGFRTSGIDFEVDYNLETEYGSFNPNFIVSYVDEFETQVNVGDPWGDQLGFATPDTRASLSLNWSLGDFGVGIVGDYIGDSESTIANAPVPMPSWTTWNAQATWNTPWDGKVTIGARNLGDKEPPISTRLPHPYYLNSQYNYYGRVPYVRYEQRF